MSVDRTVWLLTPSRLEAEAIRPAAHPYAVQYTGVGALATLHTLWRRYFTEQPVALSLIVIGIAGSYNGKHPLGSIVYVEKEIWGDLGRRYSRRFIPTPEWLRDGFPLEWMAPPSPLSLARGIGLTLHALSANRREARYWSRSYPEATIETQEGAAFYLFGHAVGAPVYTFRAISNQVGHRRWEREAALDSLATFTRNNVVPLCERLLAGDSSAHPR
ncbi:MAG: hypothetical protein N3E49_01160 [Bacteroidia bacterium]|nr:hypothetical protein [Bacteroidia bacterium]